jgi:hypothetical protein
MATKRNIPMLDKPGKDRRKKRLQNKKRDQWKREKKLARRDYGPPKDKPFDPTMRIDDFQN